MSPASPGKDKRELENKQGTSREESGVCGHHHAEE